MWRLGFSVLIGCLILVRAVDGKFLAVNQIRNEFSASATGGRGAVKVDGTLLLPRAKEARGVIAVVHFGIGTLMYDDPAWSGLAEELQCGLLRVSLTNSGEPRSRPLAEQAVRNAAIGGAEGLLSILADIARQAGRPELQGANLILWGHSAAGSFVTTFAELHPTRMIAFVRYHSHSRGLPSALQPIAQIPGLIFAGENDKTAGFEDSEALWTGGRALQAPWAFALEPGVSHSSPEGLTKANELTIPWVRAVFAQRVGDGRASLRQVDQAAGWWASLRSQEVAPTASFRGSKAEASWLPDEASAKGWRAVSGIQP